MQSRTGREKSSPETKTTKAAGVIFFNSGLYGSGKERCPRTRSKRRRTLSLLFSELEKEKERSSRVLVSYSNQIGGNSLRRCLIDRRSGLLRSAKVRFSPQKVVQKKLNKSKHIINSRDPESSSGRKKERSIRTVLLSGNKKSTYTLFIISKYDAKSSFFLFLRKSMQGKKFSSRDEKTPSGGFFLARHKRKQQNNEEPLFLNTSSSFILVVLI